ncbi:MAG: CidA/LrgA family protein [Myxococcota bacterium]
MVRAFAILLGFQWVGEVLVRLLELPVPGPVLGFVGLLGFLAVRGGPPEDLRQTSEGLLKHLSLLFVPAGVGVVAHLERLETAGLPLVVALVIGTPAGLLVTAWMTSALAPEEG